MKLISIRSGLIMENGILKNILDSYAQSKNHYLIVKILMYGGRHTVIELCYLVGHKTIVCIGKKDCCTIPEPTHFLKDVVLPGAAQKWPVPEHNAKCMLDRDAGLTHPHVPSLLLCHKPPDRV